VIGLGTILKQENLYFKTKKNVMKKLLIFLGLQSEPTVSRNNVKYSSGFKTTYPPASVKWGTEPAYKMWLNELNVGKTALNRFDHYKPNDISYVSGIPQ